MSQIMHIFIGLCLANVFWYIFLKDTLPMRAMLKEKEELVMKILNKVFGLN